MGIQEQALAYSETVNPPYPIACLEWGDEGQRRYAVGSWQRIFKFVVFPESKQFGDRNFYELVVVKRPVKLFMDIEWYPDINPNIDFSSVQDNINALVMETIEEFHPDLKEVLKTSTVYWYDAPTNEYDKEQKKSFHMVLDIPGYAFESAFACGRLILVILYKAQKRGFQGFFADFEWKDKIVHKAVIDPSVYTRNRNFRFQGNTKLGARRWLLSPARRKLMETDWKAALTFNYDRDHKEFFGGCCTHFYPEEIANQKLIQINLAALVNDQKEIIEWARGLGYFKGILDDEFGMKTTCLAVKGVELQVRNGEIASGMMPDQIKVLVYHLLKYVSMRTVLYKDHPGYVRVLSNCRDCMIKNGRHKSNHVWFEFLVTAKKEKRGWRQRCCDPICMDIEDKQGKMPYAPFTEEEHQWINDYWDNRPPVMVDVAQMMEYLIPEVKGIKRLRDTDNDDTMDPEDSQDCHDVDIEIRS